MTQTIKERLDELKATEVQTTLGDLNEPPAFYNGFNAGVDACLPLLTELELTELEKDIDLLTAEIANLRKDLDK